MMSLYNHDSWMSTASLICSGLSGTQEGANIKDVLRRSPRVQLRPSKSVSLTRDVSKHAKQVTKMKEDGCYEQFKEAECLRHAIYRLEMSGEQKKRYNEAAKIRMRKYRTSKKEKSIAMPETNKRLTRQEQDKLEADKAVKREYNRKKKQESRARRSSQAVRREREKQREHYQNNKRKRMGAEDPCGKKPRQDQDLATIPPSIDEATPKDKHLPSECSLSNSAKRKALSRVRRHMPKDPAKWLNTLKQLIVSASPRKKRLLDESVLKMSVEDTVNRSISGNVAAGLSSLRRKRDIRSNMLRNVYADCIPRKYQKMRSTRRQLNVEWSGLLRRKNNVTKEKNKVKSNGVSDEERKLVCELYDENAVTLPTRKSVTGKKLLLKAKSVLTRTVQNIHKAYLKRSSRKVSLSKFAALRPVHMTTVTKSKMNQCLCEKCTNCDMKLQTLNRICGHIESSLKLNDRYICVDKTLCAKINGRRQMSCLDRNCEECGVKCLEEHYKCVLKGEESEDIRTQAVSWQEWGVTKATKDGKTFKKKSLLERKATLQELIHILCDDISTLAKHLFVASWQYQQCKEVRDNLPEGAVLMQADFAENYRCDYQDEIQSAHWSYSQVTVHPIVCHYKCPKSECDETVKESLVIISSDLKHDAASVNTYMTTAYSHLQKTRSLNLDKIIQFTDGCASQYKSKEPFADISFGLETTPVERNYFGSNHGKGPCDGLGAVTKQSARRAVQSRQAIIQTAADMYEHLKDHMTISNNYEDGTCNHNPREFFLIEEIQREAIRNERIPNKGLVGTRAVHSVKGIRPGVIEYRALSCFCGPCRGGAYAECINEHIVGGWKTWHMPLPLKSDEPASVIQVDVHREDPVNR